MRSIHADTVRLVCQAHRIAEATRQPGISPCGGLFVLSGPSVGYGLTLLGSRVKPNSVFGRLRLDIFGRSRRSMLVEEQASAGGGFGLHDCSRSRYR